MGTNNDSSCSDSDSDSSDDSEDSALLKALLEKEKQKKSRKKEKKQIITSTKKTDKNTKHKVTPKAWGQARLRQRRECE
eukprot:2563584-Heterocapsa_arctica.AAC.1